jgi:hypothetical protein
MRTDLRTSIDKTKDGTSDHTFTVANVHTPDRRRPAERAAWKFPDAAPCAPGRSGSAAVLTKSHATRRQCSHGDQKMRSRCHERGEVEDIRATYKDVDLHNELTEPPSSQSDRQGGLPARVILVKHARLLTNIRETESSRPTLPILQESRISEFPKARIFSKGYCNWKGDRKKQT